jgi:hypothetical protein
MVNNVNWLLDVTLLPLLGGLRVRPSSPSMVDLSRKVSGGGLEMTDGAGEMRNESTEGRTGGEWRVAGGWRRRRARRWGQIHAFSNDIN